MSSSILKSVSDNWLVVQWKSGKRDVINVKSLVNPVGEELKNGDVLMVKREDGPEEATFIERARERNMAAAINILKDAAASSSCPTKDDEGEDFSSSESEWLPSDDGGQSGDSDGEVQAKKIKLERYGRQYNKANKKTMTISNSDDTVPAAASRQGALNETINLNKPESTDLQTLAKLTAQINSMDSISKTFTMLFAMVKELKEQLDSASKDTHEETLRDQSNLNRDEARGSLGAQSNSNHSSRESINNSTENEFNRSRDNVLITNKFKRAEPIKPKNGGNNGEWVAIGSGQTLIHKDQFKKVNWKSYTIATRTLLLAVFSRRTLATHSLTGKPSPAFQHKKAKMCLDQRITADVIMEVTERFNVPENLVRGIITTKCADECKMWKTRNKKKDIRNKENTATPQSST